MLTKQAINTLTPICEELLSDEIDFLNLKKAVTQLQSFLNTISKLNFESDINRENISLPTGKAIAPTWATMCMEDLLRTKKFVRGIDKAIKAKRENNDSKPVTILYAGTGPFATLVIPLLAKYSASEIQLALLEVNTISIKSIKNIFNEIDAMDYISSFYHCDASTFIIPESLDIDILVVECLQHALLREPQVAIVHNLLPQLPNDIILIPEEINLHVLFLDSKIRQEFMEGKIDKTTSYSKRNEDVFILNKETVLSQSEFNAENIPQFPLREIMFQSGEIEDFDEIAIGTEIKIFDSEILSLNESGLTMPLTLLREKKPIQVRGIETQYLISNSPEIKTKFIT